MTKLSLFFYLFNKIKKHTEYSVLILKWRFLMDSNH